LVDQPLIGLLYQPQMTDEYGDFDELRIGEGKEITQRNPASVSLCPLQTPHDNLGSNSGCHGGKPATKCLSYGTANH
jgi:hypothetical protein